MKPAPPVTRNVFTGRPTLPYAGEGNQRSLFATIEEEIQRRQVRDELTMKLRIRGVGVALPLHCDAVPFEQSDVQIGLRGITADVRQRPEMAADIHEPLASRTPNAKT